MGAFTPCFPNFLCGGGIVSLAILRAASNAQNSFGEVVLSFVSIGSIKVDLQPQAGGISRNVHGQVARVNFIGVVNGNPDVQEFDRSVISNVFIEVTDVLRWGGHSEIFWKWVR